MLTRACNAVQDAVSPWVWVYFLALMIFCSMFILNLALAVLYIQFTKEEVQVGDLQGCMSDAPVLPSRACSAFWPPAFLNLLTRL